MHFLATLFHLESATCKIPLLTKIGGKGQGVGISYQELGKFEIVKICTSYKGMELGFGFRCGILVCVEIAGVLAIFAGIGWLVAWAVFGHFAGADCKDSDQIVLVSPGGRHTVKTVHRVCTVSGASPSSSDTVFLSTGNTNKGYEYVPIAGFDGAPPGQTHIRWDGPGQITITYPNFRKG